MHILQGGGAGPRVEAELQMGKSLEQHQNQEFMESATIAGSQGTGRGIARSERESKVMPRKARTRRMKTQLV